MDPDDVVRVAQPQVGWILGVVAVDEFVFLDFHPRHAAAGFQVVPVFAVGGFVDVGKKSVDRLLDRKESPVEKPDHAGFSQRILGLLPAGAPGGAFPAAGRQPGRVPPFGVLLQHFVRVQPGLFDLPEQIFPVHRRARPVHQLVRQIGAFVEVFDAQRLCRVPGQGRVFIRVHVPGQREDDPDPRVLRRVAVGAVDQRAPGDPFGKGLQRVPVVPVPVQADHAPAFDAVRRSPPAAQRSADESPVVLRLVPLSLAHPGVFLGAFRRPDGVLQLFLQLCIGDFFVDPFLRLPAGPVGDAQLTHAGPSLPRGSVSGP